LLLIGADSVDDVPAKPKPAASTNAIMIERIQSSLGLDLGLSRPAQLGLHFNQDFREDARSIFRGQRSPIHLLFRCASLMTGRAQR
jgi:hypothetical protein